MGRILQFEFLAPRGNTPGAPTRTLRAIYRPLDMAATRASTDAASSAFEEAGAE